MKSLSAKLKSSFNICLEQNVIETSVSVLV